MKAFAAILALACLLPLALAGNCDADQFQVGSYVYLDKASFFSGDKFTFYIAIPQSNSNAVFAFSGAGTGCLAGDLTWTKVTAPDGSDAKADTCAPDVYKSEVQWSTLHASCGGARDNSDATDLIFTYNLLISFEQALNAADAADDQTFAFTRYIKSARRIVVRFPKQISASVTTTVTNMLTATRIPAQAALSRITVDNTSPGINTFLTLEITTAVTYPDIVSTPSLVSILDGTASRGSDLDISNDGFTLVTDDCVHQPGKVCRQKWTFKINQKSDLCGATATTTDGAAATFSGTYKVRFPVTCQSEYAYAPNCPTGDYFDMDAKVATANICPIVRSALLSASMTADSSTGYRLRQTPTFTLVTSSSTATISATSLVSVVMSQKAADDKIADITLWSASAITDAGTVAGFKKADSGAKLEGATGANNAATTVTFSAKLMPSQIVLPSTASRDVKFTATVAVTFLNTESFGAPTVSRRLLTVELPVNDRTHIHSLLSKGSDKLVAASEFKVSGEDAQEFSAVAATASSASTAIVTPLVMLLSFVVALFNLLA